MNYNKSYFDRHMRVIVRFTEFFRRRKNSYYDFKYGGSDEWPIWL